MRYCCKLNCMIKYGIINIKKNTKQGKDKLSNIREYNVTILRDAMPYIPAR